MGLISVCSSLDISQPADSYPGIRSDSDMFTLVGSPFLELSFLFFLSLGQGYSFSPWYGTKTLADGETILSYIKSTALKYSLSNHIQLSTQVTSINWSSQDSLWTVYCCQKNLNLESQTVVYQCRFICLCTGYYDYDRGYNPTFPGQDRFKGLIIHPQFWPESFDERKRNIVVIGSGATAITLVPELAKKAASVTMLQRSPTYILPLPEVDHVSNILMTIFPGFIGHTINRWKNIFAMNGMYFMSRLFPATMKSVLLGLWSHTSSLPPPARLILLIGIVRWFVGPDYDITTHFTPSYKPWDERLCIVPDGDLFTCLREGKAAIKTGDILQFTEVGIEIKNREKNNGWSIHSSLSPIPHPLQRQRSCPVTLL
jgi:monooxygenase